MRRRASSTCPWNRRNWSYAASEPSGERGPSQESSTTDAAVDTRSRVAGSRSIVRSPIVTVPSAGNANSVDRSIRCASSRERSAVARRTWKKFTGPAGAASSRIVAASASGASDVHPNQYTCPGANSLRMPDSASLLSQSRPQRRPSIRSTPMDVVVSTIRDSSTVAWEAARRRSSKVFRGGLSPGSGSPARPNR